VHIALKAAKWPWAGWTTKAGSPVVGSENEAAPPTGTLAAVPIGDPRGFVAGPDELVGPAVVEGVEVMEGSAAGAVPAPTVVGVVVPRAGVAERDGEDDPKARPTKATTPARASAAAPTSPAAAARRRKVRRSSSCPSSGRRSEVDSRTGQYDESHGRPLRRRQRPAS
jgi:hypothetical protein